VLVLFTLNSVVSLAVEPPELPFTLIVSQTAVDLIPAAAFGFTLKTGL
jgi:hypothetical protein